MITTIIHKPILNLSKTIKRLTTKHLKLGQIPKYIHNARFRLAIIKMVELKLGTTVE